MSARVALLIGLVCAATGSVFAQPVHPVDARVVQIAGSTIYLDRGLDDGLVAGDTVHVERDDVPIGRLALVSSTANRSVAVIVGPPFAVTRGESIRLLIVSRTSAPVEPDSSAVVAPPQPERSSILAAPAEPIRRSSAPRMRLTGRIQTGVQGIQSSTRPDSGSAVSRTFATPFVSLRSDVTGLPGGATLHVNGRIDYRYADGPGLSELGELRLYGAALGLTRGPVQMTLGRFASQRERVSGFWDGADVQIGSDAAGAGLLVGVQPVRTSGLPDAERPKAAVYAYTSHRSGATTARASATAGRLFSNTGASFVGADAAVRGRSGSTVYGASLDGVADETPDGWGLARASLRASVAPGPIRLGVALRRFRPSVLTTFSLPLLFDVEASTRDSGTLDVSVQATRRASLYADGGLYRSAGVSDGSAVGGGIRLAQSPALGVGVSLDLRSRRRAAADALYGSARLTRQFGKVSATAGYSLSRTALSTQTLSTHGFDASLTAPLTRRLGFVVQGGVYGGGGLRRSSLYTSLWVRL